MSVRRPSSLLYHEMNSRVRFLYKLCFLTIFVGLTIDNISLYVGPVNSSTFGVWGCSFLMLGIAAIVSVLRFSFYGVELIAALLLSGGGRWIHTFLRVFVCKWIQWFGLEFELCMPIPLSVSLTTTHHTHTHPNSWYKHYYIYTKQKM